MDDHQTPAGDEDQRAQEAPETPETASANQTPESESEVRLSPQAERRRQRATELNGASEKRIFATQDIEVRETSDGMIRFTGYASITEHPYEVADFTETIARGAFKRTLGEDPDVVLLINHGQGGTGLPIARTKSGTLRLSEDARGLRVDADLNPADPDVRAIVPKMQRGDADQMSFAFRATSQTWSEDYSQRLIQAVTIHRGDVSIVSMGANPDTTSSVESLRSVVHELEERAGRTLSAKTRSDLEAVKAAISDLLESNDQPPEDEDEATDRSNTPATDPSKGGGAAEPQARAVILPDYTTRARARVEAMRRVS